MMKMLYKIIACGFCLIAAVYAQAQAAEKSASNASKSTASEIQLQAYPRLKNPALSSGTAQSVQTESSGAGNLTTNGSLSSGTKITAPGTANPASAGVINNRDVGKINNMSGNLSGMRDAANIKQMQEMEKLKQRPELSNLNGQNRSNDPASGTALGGRGFSKNNTPGNRDQQAGKFNAQDCIADPRNCNRSGGSRRGGFTAGPTATPGGMTKGTNQSWAAGDGKGNDNSLAHGGMTARTEQSSKSNGDGTTTTVTNEYNSKGDLIATTESTTDDKTGAGFSDDVNHLTGERTHTDIKSDGYTSTVYNNSKGDRIGGFSGPVMRPRWMGEQGSQPREDGRSQGGGNNCNWNPVWGRCMGNVETLDDRREKNKKGIGPTVQPGAGENQDGSTGTGNAVNLQLRGDAVTNTGDAGFSTLHSRSGAGGGEPDPCVLVQGGDCGNGPDPYSGPASPAGVR